MRVGWLFFFPPAGSVWSTRFWSNSTLEEPQHFPPQFSYSCLDSRRQEKSAAGKSDTYVEQIWGRLQEWQCANIFNHLLQEC